MQRVEDVLQVALLLQLGRLLAPAVIAKRVQLALHLRQRVVGVLVLEERHLTADPSQKVRRDALVVLHQLLVLLVRLEHLADAVGCGFSLQEARRQKVIAPFHGNKKSPQQYEMTEKDMCVLSSPYYKRIATYPSVSLADIFASSIHRNLFCALVQ